MRKTINFYILGVAIFLVGILNVHAAASLSIVGDSSIKYGETANYNINIATDGNSIKKVQFTISYNSSILTITNSSTSYGYLSLVVPGSTSVVSTLDGSGFTDGTIATIDAKNTTTSNASTSITLENIVFTLTDDSTVNGTNASKTPITLSNTTTTTTKALSSEAKLTGLKVSVGTLSPTFSSTTTEYEVYNIKDTINSVTLTLTGDPSYKITCTSGCTNSTSQTKLTLAVGENDVTIATTSQDGKNTYTYNLAIYRGETTKNSAYLSALSIEGFDINEDFAKSTLDYTATVSYETEELSVTATPEDSDASVVVKGNTDLKVGENVITITVTSSDGTAKNIYNITVTREEYSTTTTTKALISSSSSSSKKIIMIVVIAGIGLVIIGVSGYFIFRKDKKGKKNKNNTPIEPEETEEDNQDGLVDELNLSDDDNNTQTFTTIDEALNDLMQTKELKIYHDDQDKY